MKKKDIKVGKIYYAKVSGKLCAVKIIRESPPGYGGWEAINTRTNKSIWIKTAGRLRGEVSELEEADFRSWLKEKSHGN